MTDIAQETDGQLLQRIGTNGKLWAEAFSATAKRLGYSDMDEGWLIGWFANAIEAGRSAGLKASEPMRVALEAWAAAEDMVVGNKGIANDFTYPQRFAAKQEAKVRAHQMMRAALASTADPAAQERD